jgi:hypothetical protein
MGTYFEMRNKKIYILSSSVKVTAVMSDIFASISHNYILLGKSRSDSSGGSSSCSGSSCSGSSSSSSSSSSSNLEENLT